MSCRDCDDKNAALLDFSGLFSTVRDTLQKLNATTSAIATFVAKISTREDFTMFAGGASEIQVQQGRNGRIRQIANLSGNLCNVIITDGSNTQLLGTAATPYPLAAGVVLPLWLPFKNGLRVNASQLLSVSGEVTFL